MELNQAIKKTLILALTESTVDCTFKPSLLSEFNQEVNLTDTAKAFCGKGEDNSTRVEDGDYHLEWKLLDIPHVVQMTPAPSQIKEVVLLDKKPASNVLTLEVDSNLNPQISRQGEIVEWCYGANEMPAFVWARIVISDRFDNIYYGNYLPAISAKNIRIEMPDIPSDSYPIEIDPTTSIFTGSITNLTGERTLGYKMLAFNGSRYTTFFVYNNATGMKTFTATIPTVTTGTPNWADNTSGPFNSRKLGAVYDMASGNQLFIASDSGGTFGSAVLDAGGSWSAETSLTGHLNNFRNRWDGCVGHDGNFWYVAKSSTAQVRLAMTSNEGSTWNQFGSYADPVADVGHDTRDGIALISLDATHLLMIYQDGGAPGKLRETIYDIAGDSWSTPVDIIASGMSNRPGSKYQLAMNSDGNVYGKWEITDNEGWGLRDAITGNWTLYSEGAGNWFGEVPMSITDDDKLWLGNGLAHLDEVKYYEKADLATRTELTPSATNVRYHGGSPMSNTVKNQMNLMWIGTGSGDVVIVEQTGFQTPGIADTDPPTITNLSPASAATGISIGANIYFELDDDVSGVDPDTINLTIDGTPAITLGVFQAGYSGSIVLDGTGLGYDVTISPDTAFEENQQVSVSVSGVEDLSANVMATTSWSFITAVSYGRFFWRNRLRGL